jgi:NAD(P)H-hydrate epimerase
MMSGATHTSTPAAAPGPAGQAVLPADDPAIFDLDLRRLREHWAEAAARPPMSGEAMTGADRRAQSLGMPAQRLMEHAGTAVAAAAKALAIDTERWGHGPILILCGPGNNGGDGFVAARRLALAGAEVIAALISSEPRPRTPEAGKNWDRLDRERRVTRLHAETPHDVAILGQGVERASLVIDALLGSGVHGALREPIRTAVEVVSRARRAGVPILAVDTPTAVDLTSGEPSDPVVHAHLTVTFHRPKTGLRRKVGAALAGRVLVAPIGISRAADPW